MIIRSIRKAVYLSSYVIDSVLHRNCNLFILCYHSIAGDGWRFSSTLENFEKQMNYLTRRYTPVTIRDISKHIHYGRSIPKPAFAVTFDDGYRNILSVRDICKKYHIQPTVFIVSDDINIDRNQLGADKPLLSYSDICTLINDGWEIGSHSLTHRGFNRLKHADLVFEIDRSKKILERRFHRQIQYFAYPKGYYSNEILDIMKHSGYLLGLSMDDGNISISSNPFSVPRIGVDGSHDSNEFKGLFLPCSISIRGHIKRSFLKKYIV
jgi:peptidoglycan/xylan/chitin deacetylase (PgdA/CDA1 family)